MAKAGLVVALAVGAAGVGAAMVGPTGAEPTVLVSSMGVLGWWDGEAWVQWEPGVAAPLVGGEQYVTLTIATRGAAVGGPPVPPEEPTGCGLPPAGLAPLVALTGEDAAPHRFPLAATGPAWELGGAQPGREVPPDDAAAVVPGQLVTQAIEGDLDGDGTDDLLLTVDEGHGAVSVLLVRADRTDVLHRVEPTDLFTHTEVTALLDANGDGSVEILLDHRYDHSAAVSLIDLAAPTPRPVLTATCPN